MDPGEPGAVQRIYRLVLWRRDGGVIRADAPHRHYRRARAGLADAVRRAAADDALGAVTLESASLEVARLGPARNQPSAPVWVTIDSWDAAVIARILTQAGQRDRRESHPLEPAPGAGQRAAAEGASPAGTQRRSLRLRTRRRHSHPAARSRYRRNGWRLAATATGLALMWITLALLQSGGHLVEVLTAAAGTPPTVVQDLRFDGPGRRAGCPEPIPAEPPSQGKLPQVRPGLPPAEGSGSAAPRPSKPRRRPDPRAF